MKVRMRKSVLAAGHRRLMAGSYYEAEEAEEDGKIVYYVQVGGRLPVVLFDEHVEVIPEAPSLAFYEGKPGFGRF